MVEDVDLSNFQSENTEQKFEEDLIASLSSEWDYLGEGAEFSSNFDYEASDVVIESEFLDCLQNLNPDVPTSELKKVVETFQSFCRISTSTSSDAVLEKKQEMWQAILKKRSTFAVEDEEGNTTRPVIIDFEEFSENSLTVANQVTYSYGGNRAEFDIVLFINGIPFIVSEVKYVGKSGTAKTATADIRTYEDEFPGFFVPTLASIGVSDMKKDTDAEYIAPLYYRAFGVSERFESPWYDEAEEQEFNRGIEAFRDFCRSTILRDLYRYGQFFMQKTDGNAQILARHQQFFVSKRIVKDVRAKLSLWDDGKISLKEVQREFRELVSHTQGSGKTYAMLFAAQWVRSEVVLPWDDNEALKMLVVVDRENLDEALKSDLEALNGMNLTWERVDSSVELKKQLEGNVDLVVTTIQKFRTFEPGEFVYDEFVVTFEDEVHREMLKKQGATYETVFPKAIRYGFTGTPTDDIVNEFGDKEPPFFFHEYSLRQALQEDVTVPVNIVRVLPETVKSNLSVVDKDFKEAISKANISEAEANEMVQRMGYSAFEEYWPSLREEIARFIAEDFKREYLGSDENAMVVCSSRKLVAQYVDLLEEELGEETVAAVYSSQNDDEGIIKEKDELSKSEAVKRFKKSEDPLQLLVVCDMLLTGFDAPMLKSIYLNRDMSQQHMLEQTIARVNRPREGKEFGKIVDLKNTTSDLEIRKEGGEFTTLDADIEEIMEEYKDSLKECLEVLGIDSFSEFETIFNGDYKEYLFEVFNDSRERREEFMEVFRIARSYREQGLPSKQVLKYEDVFDVLSFVYNYATPEKPNTPWDKVSKAGGEVLDENISVSGFGSGQGFTISREEIEETQLQKKEIHRLKTLKEQTKEIEKQFPNIEHSFSERAEELIGELVHGDMSRAEISAKREELKNEIKKAQEETVPEVIIELEELLQDSLTKEISQEDAKTVYNAITDYALESGDKGKITTELYKYFKEEDMIGYGDWNTEYTLVGDCVELVSSHKEE